VAVLTAFCDETHVQDRAEFSFVGGYIFDAEGHRQFTEKWAAVLKPLQSRGVRFFHAAPCDAGQDAFKKLSFAERRVLFGDLISLIRSTAKCGIAVSLQDETFKKVIERNKFQEFTGAKYTVCSFRLLTAIATWANENKFEGKIAYRFESGNEHQSEADFMMRQIESNSELSEQFRYGGHSFEPKYALPPLQAADLWIWLCQKMWYRENNEPNPYWDNLRKQPGIPHLMHKIGALSFGTLAFMNMTHGIKSNREYEKQTGKVRRYTI
jgi:hypothetical protein